MILFRASFITASAFLFIMVASVSASPQFPKFRYTGYHVENVTTAISAEPSASSAAPQAAEMVGSSDSPTSGGSGYPSKKTSGARISRHTNGETKGIILGAAAFFVYSIL